MSLYMSYALVTELGQLIVPFRAHSILQAWLAVMPRAHIRPPSSPHSF